MELPAFKIVRWDVGPPICVAGGLWFKARAVADGLRLDNQHKAC